MTTTDDLPKPENRPPHFRENTISDVEWRQDHLRLALKWLREFNGIPPPVWLPPQEQRYFVHELHLTAEFLCKDAVRILEQADELADHPNAVPYDRKAIDHGYHRILLDGGIGENLRTTCAYIIDLAYKLDAAMNADRERPNRAELTDLVEASWFEIVCRSLSKLTKDERTIILSKLSGGASR
jgi:hypothetical protein